MRLFRYALVALLFVIFGAAIYQTMTWLGIWGGAQDTQVKPLGDDEQEIAFLQPATSGDDWGRLATAVQLVAMDWPRINPSLPALNVSLDDAFPKLTAEVPEIVLWFASAPKQRLRLRWYKISGEHDAASWVAKLHARGRAPLAFIGGATSDRAVQLARALRETYPDADAASPVFLITTATAETTAENKPLIQEYPARSFRYSFTNKRMVEALLKFVQQTPNLWLAKGAAPPDLTMNAFVWGDERYSQDLTDLFALQFRERFPRGRFHTDTIPYSVGGFFHPAPIEQASIDIFISRPTPPYSLLVLPTQTIRMRRFLINLRQRSPHDARNLVILNGDAISFNSVYRDRDVVWNILDLPYSLVFFSHRNPIDAAAGFTWTRDDRDETQDAFPQQTTTGTHDVLLYRDVLESFLYSAYENGGLLDDAQVLRDRLKETCWYHPPPERMKNDFARVCNPRIKSHPAGQERFFSKIGNRRRRTGEHIVWVKPSFTDDRVDLTSTIGIWSMLPQKAGEGWQLVEAHDVKYNQNR